jgi:hypothetical protein
MTQAIRIPDAIHTLRKEGFAKGKRWKLLAHPAGKITVQGIENKQKARRANLRAFVFWCGREDSNFHGG